MIAYNYEHAFTLVLMIRLCPCPCLPTVLCISYSHFNLTTHPRFPLGRSLILATLQ
jgi:hypothetical protein